MPQVAREEGRCHGDDDGNGDEVGAPQGPQAHKESPLQQVVLPDQQVLHPRGKETAEEEAHPDQAERPHRLALVVFGVRVVVHAS